MRTKRRTYGNCFVVAAKLVLGWLHDTFLEHRRTQGDTVYLVHGQVRSPATGRWHCHAWVEVEAQVRFPGLLPDAPTIPVVLVVDRSNGNSVEMPKELYYDLGCVRNVRRYTKQQVLESISASHVYGPWKE